MKEAIVSAGPKVRIVDSPVPRPGPNQVLIKVVIAAANPKDWKVPEWTGIEVNQGDDCAGIVEAVGNNVVEFSPGDRVAGFHEVSTPGGTYAEYAICPAHTTFHIPKTISFEGAATVPLTAGTAAAGLFESFGGLRLPLPIQPAVEPLPLVIYGASGSVGTFALQLAGKANIHPLICVAGGGGSTIEPLIDRSKGDVVVDYRKGDAEVVAAIVGALKGLTLRHALDTAAHGKSTANIAEAMTDGGKIARTLPPENGLSGGVEQFQVSVSSVHGDQKYFGFVMYQLFANGLKEGWLQPRPYEIVPGGLDGVEQALAKLKAGKASALKYIFRISDTQGVD